MIRILHIVESTTAGVRTYLQNLLAGLDRQRFQHVLVCPPRREHAFGDERFVDFLAAQSIPMLGIELRRSVNLRVDLAMLLHLVTIIHATRCDIVHLHSSKAGLLGRVAARLLTHPRVVYSPHGLFFAGERRILQRWFYRSIEQFAGPLSSRIIAASRSERETLIRARIASPQRVALIEYGITIPPPPDAAQRAAARAALGLTQQAPLIGTAARVSAQKNPALFVAAAAQALQRRPDLQFVWIGGGELQAAALERVERLGIGAHCHFIGHREQAAQLLAGLDLFWLTSDWESFGMATIEAMAMQRPVIVTDVPGSRDIVQHGSNGLLVPPQDARALATATLALLDDPPLQARLAEQGRQLVVEHYSAARMTQATATLYESLLAQAAELPERLRVL